MTSSWEASCSNLGWRSAGWSPKVALVGARMLTVPRRWVMCPEIGERPSGPRPQIMAWRRCVLTGGFAEMAKLHAGTKSSSHRWEQRSRRVWGVEGWPAILGVGGCGPMPFVSRSPMCAFRVNASGLAGGNAMAPAFEHHRMDESTTYLASQSSRMPEVSRMLSCPPRLRWASGLRVLNRQIFPGFPRSGGRPHRNRKPRTPTLVPFSRITAGGTTGL